MPDLAPAPGRKLADERGFTLVELLVATTIALLVAAGAMMVLQFAVKTQPQVSERAAQIQQGRTLIETISRELRQGDLILAATETGLHIHTYVNSATCGGAPAASSTPCWVTYSCEGDSCSRTEHQGSGAGSPEQVVSGVLDPNVFCYAPQRDQEACPVPSVDDPSYVGITLSFPDDEGEETVTLRDGIALRNHQVPPE